VTIASRTAERARALATRFARIATVAPDYASAVRDCDLVVNATPIGIAGEAVPVDPANLGAGALVFDLVYRRGGTPWVLRARAHGHAAADGLEMLVEQGAIAFSRWFGIEPDRAAMWGALR
jgi:shikimate dehydrogenase